LNYNYYHHWILLAWRQVLEKKIRVTLHKTSRLRYNLASYCNSVLTGLPDSTLQQPKFFHTAARLVKDLRSRDHITQPLKQLHWLPIHALISFKVNLFMFNIYSGSSPVYMSSLVTPCSESNSRRNLRSATKGDFVVPRSNIQFGNRCFSFAEPAEWNRLPESVWCSATSYQFKSRLKTFLFFQYYN